MSTSHNQYHPLDRPGSPQGCGEDVAASDSASSKFSYLSYPPSPRANESATSLLAYMGLHSPFGEKSTAAKGTAQWNYRRYMLGIPILAVVLQTILLVGSIYVAVHPWIMPYDDYISSWSQRGKFTLKEYNVFVSLVGAVISAVAGLALAIGVKSYIARSLASDGISLETYETLRKIGESRLPSRVSAFALAPVVLFLVSNSAAPAAISIWQAGIGQVKLTVDMNFIAFAATYDYHNSTTEQSSPWEYESFVYRLHDRLGALFSNGSYDVDHEDVDGNTDFYLMDGLSAVLPMSDSGINWGIDLLNSGTTTIRLSTPLVVAQSNCITPTSLLATNLTSVDDGTVHARVEDQLHCPGSAWDLVYSNQSILSSMVHCYQNGTSYAGYFFINATSPTPTFTPIPSCLTTVAAGTKSGLSYSDWDPGWRFENSIAPSASELIQELDYPADATELSHNLVAQLWSDQSLGGRGSPTLNNLVEGLHDLDCFEEPRNSSAEAMLPTVFASLTRGIAAMAVSKQLHAETWASLSASEHPGTVWSIGTGASPPSGIVTPALVTCSCLKVGPSGWGMMYLGVVAAMWLAVLLALVVSLRNPPVSLDPLDPISMLLVAQHSPPSERLERGCTGDVDRLRSRKVKMRLRAVDSECLGFVYGDERALASLPSPEVGRSYGPPSRRQSMTSRLPED